MVAKARSLLITDLDNTLWDWFEAWHCSFSALINGLEQASGLPRETLEQEIKKVHQKRGTTEYSNLISEVPSLVSLAGSAEQTWKLFDSALHAQSSARVRATHLYTGVRESLKELKRSGVKIVAYTESGAFWSSWRLQHTGLDGVIDTLYSSVDHDLHAGVDADQLRTGHYPNSYYELRTTKHHHLPFGTLKPSPEVLRRILDEQNTPPDQAIYIGDSLMKDIRMAQQAGVLDVYAAYGKAHMREEYDLLRRVTHWTQQDVDREKALTHQEVEPTHTIRSFSEILRLV